MFDSPDHKSVMLCSLSRQHLRQPFDTPTEKNDRSYMYMQLLHANKQQYENQHVVAMPFT